MTKELLKKEKNSTGINSFKTLYDIIGFYYDADKNDCGVYNHATHSTELNRSLLNDPGELIDTIAHELRHAYQHQKAMAPESELDLLYRVNFDNYISPLPLGDGKFLFFTDYQDQLVEVEARAFAKQFSKMEVAI